MINKKDFYLLCSSLRCLFSRGFVVKIFPHILHLNLVSNRLNCILLIIPNKSIKRFTIIFFRFSRKISCQYSAEFVSIGNNLSCQIHNLNVALYICTYENYPAICNLDDGGLSTANYLSSKNSKIKLFRSFRICHRQEMC